MNQAQPRRRRPNQMGSLPWYENPEHPILRTLLAITVVYILVLTFPGVAEELRREFASLRNLLRSPPTQSLDQSIAEGHSWLTIFILALLFALFGLVRTIYAILAIAFCVFTWIPVQVISLLTLGSSWTSHIDSIFNYVSSLPNWWLAFLTLFTFKFVKVLIHTLSYNFLYFPAVPSDRPILRPNDVTVIIPTTGDLGLEFALCVQTILLNQPAEVIISTFGNDKLSLADQVCAAVCSQAGFPAERVRCIAAPRPGRRTLISTALRLVDTRIVAIADDHVYWPSTLVASTLANFENPAVGYVATARRVHRQHPVWPEPITLRGLLQWLSDDFRNYIACVSLERSNFECTASSAIDGGFFVDTGRTVFLRSSIVTDGAFLHAFTSEKWGSRGPMDEDSDAFVARYMVNNGFETVFHHTPRATIQTTLGISDGWERFNSQLLSQARTTWRSLYTTLFVDRVVWRSQPWSVLFVYIAALPNFALFYDWALLVALQKIVGPDQKIAMRLLGGAILASKMVKPLGHWLREPTDILYLPAGVLFAYCHSLLKLWALLTVTEGPVDPASAGAMESNAADTEQKSRVEDKRELLHLARRMRTVAQRATNEAILAERRAVDYGKPTGGSQSPTEVPSGDGSTVRRAVVL